jgi:RNA polymerase sigma-70 factor (ECF subfamily)
MKPERRTGMPELVMPTKIESGDASVSPNSTEEIWRMFGDRLRAFITRRVGSAADAEDILQDVFLRIHLHANSVQRSERLTSWLFQVTRNAIIDYYRAPVRREQPEAVAGPESLDRTVPAVHPLEMAVDAVQAREELAGCLQPMLGRLPPHYREAVTLVDLSGLTQVEVAARLGLSVSGVKSRVQRGRRALQATLVQCCPVQLDTRRRIIDYQPPESACSGCPGPKGDAPIALQQGRREHRCCSPATGPDAPGSLSTQP